jgi:hypothetical protein
VNIGRNENSKLKNDKKYHKQLQTLETPCGQSVSPHRHEAKDTLEGSKRKHRCILCNCASNSQTYMVQHMHRKHAGLFIVCKHNGICSKIFQTEAEKSEHIREVTNRSADLTKCDFCGLIYRKSDKVNHFKIHHKNDKLIRCSYGTCSTLFRSELEKQNHEVLVHSLTKKEKCIFCNNLFNKFNILRHYRKKHTTLFANAFKCKFRCKRYFLTEADRDEHIASAHKIKVVVRAEAQCLYCNKIFIDKDVLSDHITKHHLLVKIRCKFVNCGQYFHTQTEADKHFRQQHQKIEENKKYRCLKCNFRATCKYNVKYHFYAVHGEKSLPCRKCSRCFSSSFTLKAHIKQAHSTRKSQKVCPYCNKSIINIRMHLKQEKCKRCQKVLLCVRVAQLHKTFCKL